MDANPVDVTAVNAAAHEDFLAGVAQAAPVQEEVRADISPAVAQWLDAQHAALMLEAHPDVRAALGAIAECDGLEVLGREDFIKAGSVIARLKKGERAAAEYKKTARAPMVEQLRSFDRACTAVIEAIGDATKLLNARMTKWRQAEEVLNAQVRSDANEAAAALQQELAERARAAGLAEPPQVEVYIPPPPKTVDVEGGRVTVTSRWTYHIEDEDAVPREYCEPAAGKLRTAVNAGVRSIPGVRIFQHDTAGYRGA